MKTFGLPFGYILAIFVRERCPSDEFGLNSIRDFLILTKTIKAWNRTQERMRAK